VRIVEYIFYIFTRDNFHMPHARIVFDLDSSDCVMLIISLGDPSACRLAHLVSCLVLLAVCISVLHTDATLPSFELNFALNEIWI